MKAYADFDEKDMQVSDYLGYLLIGIAFFVMVAGTIYYVRFRKRLDVLSKK